MKVKNVTKNQEENQQEKLRNDFEKAYDDYKKALVYELIGGLVAGTLILIEGLIMIIQKYYINPKKQNNKTV